MTGRINVIVLSLILGLVGATGAWAVGYERLETPQPKKQAKSVGIEAPSNGSFMKKCPALLDETAAVVKDILSQFGLIDKKTP
jgi:hypothetical protein